MNIRTNKKIIIRSFLLTLAIVIIAASVYTVESGEVGVLSRLGKYDNKEKTAGLHFKVPFIDSVRSVNIKQHVVQEGISAMDRNNLPVAIHVSFKWSSKADKASEQLQNYSDDMYNSLIKPTIRKKVRDTIGNYNGEDIAEQREKLAVELTNIIQEDFDSYSNKFFNFIGIDIREIALDASVMNKIRAVQMAKQKEKELKNEVLQKEQEKQKKKIDADAAYYVKIKESEAKAKALLTIASAQAKANEIINASLTPLLISNSKVNRWNGVLPRVSANDGIGLLLSQKD